MLLQMRFKRPSCPKRSDAICIRTNQLLHFSVDHQKMVYHLLVSDAVDAAVGATGFAMICLQMGQQMKSVIVCC